MDPRSERYPLLDSLRAIAALAVLGTHAAFFAGLYRSGADLGPYAARLEAGVAVFFLISGFLLYRPFVLARVEAHQPMAVRAYAWRRFLRIVPAYWVALTVAALALSLPGVFSSDGVATYYLVGQGYREGSIGGGIAQAWSLTIEVAFYAFLPLWAALMRRVPGATRAARVRSDAIAIGLLFVVGVAYKLVVLSGAGDGAVRITPELIALPAYFDQFALGMGLALVTVAWPADARPRAVQVVARFSGAGWLAAAVAFWAAATQIGLDPEFGAGYTAEEYFARHMLYAVIGLGMILPAVLGRPGVGLVPRLLDMTVLRYLGLISYGIFLWHLAFMSKLDEWGFSPNDLVHPYVGWVAVGVAGAVVLGSLSYYLVERPALSLKRLVPGRIERGEAVEETAPIAP